MECGSWLLGREAHPGRSTWCCSLQDEKHAGVRYMSEVVLVRCSCDYFSLHTICNLNHLGNNTRYHMACIVLSRVHNTSPPCRCMKRPKPPQCLMWSGPGNSCRFLPWYPGRSWQHTGSTRWVDHPGSCCMGM